MGYYSERYIEFLETYPRYEEGEPKFDFMIEVYDILLKAGQNVNDYLVQEFLNDIFPELYGKEVIWAMASVGALTYNISFTDVNEASKGLQALSKKDINLFFSPGIFKGWRRDKNVSRINTIYVDIDDVGDVDFSLMNEEDIKSYLITTFHLTPEKLPNWVVCSGHGLHLYYLIDTLNMKKPSQAELRMKYTDYLIAYFGADIACRNKSRILRFPKSKNVKYLEDIRSTQLYHLNTSNDKSINRLDCFADSPEAIENYIRECNARKSEKRKRTMEMNGTLQKKKDKSAKASTKKAAPIIKNSKTAKEKTVKPWIPPHPELEVKMTPLGAKTRYRRILRDLHNYAARRGGVPKGHRAIYTHIIAEILFRMYLTEFEAKCFIGRYIDREFLPEAESIIESVFQAPKRYMYRNEKIAELLEFDVEELKNSFASYTDKQKKAARKKAVNDYDVKRHGKNRMIRRKEQEYRILYIKNRPEETAANLAEKLNCSVRTVRYIRSTIRKEKD